MKGCKKILGIVLVVSLLAGSLPTMGKADAAAKKVTALKSKKMTVTVGKKATIKLKNKVKKHKYTYKSNKKKIATVSKKGVVKGIKKGTAKITVKEIYKKKGKKKKTTRKVGVVTVKVKAKDVGPVVTPAPVIPTPTPAVPTPSDDNKTTATPTPSPKKYEITHEDFNYEGLDMERMSSIKERMEASAASGQAIKLVAFAFDDGPVAWNTAKDSTAKRIIDALVNNGQNGTFFYWGNRINSGSQQEIIYAKEKGCEIANHTYSHPYLTQTTTANIQSEVERCRAKLEELTGYKNFLLRLPYLAYNDRVKAAIKVPLISCGVDSGDWDNGTYDSVMQKMRTAESTGKLENSIILMHENYDFTAQAVETLVPELKAKGYEIVSVSELAYLKGKTLQAGYVYTYIN